MPITNVASGPQVVVVNPSSPAKTLKELIAVREGEARRAQLRPCGHRHARPTSPPRTSLYTAGIRCINVPYKGEGPAITDLVAGQIKLVTPNLAGRDRLRPAGTGFAHSRSRAAARSAAARTCPRRRRPCPASRTSDGSASWRRPDTPQGSHRQDLRDTREDAQYRPTCRASFARRAWRRSGNTPRRIRRSSSARRARAGRRSCTSVASLRSEVGRRSCGSIRARSRRSRQGALHPRAQDPAARRQGGLRRARARARPTRPRSGVLGDDGPEHRASPRRPTTCCARTPASRSTT